MSKPASATPKSRQPQYTDADFECPICLQTLDRPVTLPCRHTLCMSCLVSCVQNVKRECPVCRRTISVWLRRRVQIPVNHSLCLAIAARRQRHSGLPPPLSSSSAASKSSASTSSVASEAQTSRQSDVRHIMSAPGELKRKLDEMEEEDDRRRAKVLKKDENLAKSLCLKETMNFCKGFADPELMRNAEKYYKRCRVAKSMVRPIVAFEGLCVQLQGEIEEIIEQERQDLEFARALHDQLNG